MYSTTSTSAECNVSRIIVSNSRCIGKLQLLWFRYKRARPKGERSRNDMVITVRNGAEHTDTVESVRLVAPNSSLSRLVLVTLNHFASSPILCHSFVSFCCSLRTFYNLPTRATCSRPSYFLNTKQSVEP